VTASTYRGRKRGPTGTGAARLLGADEAEGVRKLLATKYPVSQGRLVPALHKRKGWTSAVSHYWVLSDVFGGPHPHGVDEERFLRSLARLAERA
jgi:hypothetical protein